MNDFNHDLRKLELTLNQIECPDCGGVHSIHINRHDLKPEPGASMLGLPCRGYMDLVNRNLDSLKSRYHIGDMP